jgi:hypothetical protein
MVLLLGWFKKAGKAGRQLCGSRRIGRLLAPAAAWQNGRAAFIDSILYSPTVLI